MKAYGLGRVPMSVRAGREASPLGKWFALKRLALWAVAVAFLYALSPLAHVAVGNGFTVGLLPDTVFTENPALQTGAVTGVTFAYSPGSILEWSSDLADLTDWQPVEGLPTGGSETQASCVTFSKGEGSTNRSVSKTQKHE